MKEGCLRLRMQLYLFLAKEGCLVYHAGRGAFVPHPNLWIPTIWQLVPVIIHVCHAYVDRRYRGRRDAPRFSFPLRAYHPLVGFVGHLISQAGSDNDVVLRIPIGCIGQPEAEDDTNIHY